MPQEIVYDLPNFNLLQQNVINRNIPKLADIKALTFAFDITAGVSDVKADKLKIKLLADTENFEINKQVIEFLMNRYFHIQPKLDFVPASNSGKWLFSIPVNVPIKSFENIQLEIDVSGLEGLSDATKLNAVVGIVYGEAVPNLFLTIHRQQESTTGASKITRTPPIKVELLDLFVYGSNGGTLTDVIDNIVYKVGSERLYDMSKDTVLSLSTLDSEQKYYDAKDNFFISFNPTLIGTSDMTLELEVSDATTLDIYYLVRKTVGIKPSNA